MGLKPVPLALLPPIPLYRRLLRSHRKHLPTEMRLLGDEYIKSEFRAHRNIDNPVHIVGFLTEWQLYAQKLEGDQWKGEQMEKSKVDKMSGMAAAVLRHGIQANMQLDEQIAQMYELMNAIREKELQENDPEYLPHTPPKN
ncbi:hypothetical protein MBLNU459_g4227t2 [Dothideomycetes sp. NU459]